MTRRFAAFAAAVLVAATACRAIPAPSDGVLSVGSIQLPSPGVVAGDTMRDSTGRAAPLRLYAFGVGGESDTLQGAVATYILLDRGAHVTPGGYLVGDSARDTPVRLIGTIGSLQTQAVDVAVTPLPDSIGRTSTTPIDTVRFITGDSTSSANFSAPLAATVVASGTALMAPVSAVIVHYAITHAPTPTGIGVSGVLVDVAGHPASADTTDATGMASLRIRVRPSAQPGVVDSFVVTATASYRGVLLRGAPVQFVIPVFGSIVAASRRP